MDAEKLVDFTSYYTINKKSQTCASQIPINNEKCTVFVIYCHVTVCHAGQRDHKTAFLYFKGFNNSEAYFVNHQQYKYLTTELKFHISLHPQEQILSCDCLHVF